MRRLSLINKFSLLLLVALTLFGFALGKIIASTMHQNMINRANEMAASFIAHEIKEKLDIVLLATPQTGVKYKEMSRQIADFNLGPDIVKIKIWNRNFTIVWSTVEDEVGSQSPGHHELLEVYRGKIVSEIVSGDHLKAKYNYAGEIHDVMELYIPVRISPQDEVSLVFEAYLKVDHLLADIAQHKRIVWGSIVTGMLLLYLLLFVLVWRGSRQIDKQGAEIRRYGERFSSLIHSAKDGIISGDRSGKIFIINEAAEKIFGYTEAEAKSMSFGQLFDPADNDDFTLALQRFEDSGEFSFTRENLEITGLHKSGRKIPLEVSLSVSGEKDSNVLLTGMIRDISQRQKMLEQIAFAKKEWEETFDTINDAITIHDNDYNIVRANRAAEKILGISLQEIFRQKCFVSYHGTDCPPDICLSCQTVKTGIESLTEIYEPHLGKYLEIKALPRFNKDSSMRGFVHIVRDITDRKKAEEQHAELQTQLVQLQKMETIGRLAGGIAHDFNNILSAIIGYSELVLEQLPKESELYQDVTTIKESGEKAAVLTGQLLAFSRQQVLKIQPLDVNVTIESMVKLIRRLIGENITLDLHLAPEINSIKADPGQLEQIILNLAVNAGDAMPDGGDLIIETSEVQMEKDYTDQHPDSQLGKYVLLSLSDTGTGMDEEVKRKIFDPFFTTKEWGKGTGLGLATVYGIVKQHEGQVYVYSEPGKGTTFKIFFPISEDTAEAQSDTIVASALPEGKETILLAEDDRAISRMLKLYLEPLGYNLLLAENGKEAVDISRAYEGAIDLLLTDIIMPKMNGQELADTIKKERPDTKIIFMSGYTDDVITRHGVLDKNVNFLQKPITPSKLAQVLREALNVS